VIEPSIKLDHRRAQFVGLIYAEAAMNTVKYAFPNDAAGKMEVRFRRLNGTFEMTVSDNGIGFDPATTPPGRGTKLMQEIAQQLQGTLRLERLPIGMAVRLTFADSV
jgi:two-component sensor histidine kinase